MYKKVIYIRAWGGLGDIVLSTPLLQELKQKKNSKIIVLCITQKYKEIYENNPYIDSIKLLNRVNNFVFKVLANLKIIEVINFNYAKLIPSLLFEEHATKIMGRLHDLSITDLKPQIYLKVEEDLEAQRMLTQYNHPIIIHPSTSLYKNKIWSKEKWEALIESIPSYTFIQIGSEDEEKIIGAINLSGLTIRKSMALIKYSKAFVGLDSFYGHVAAAFEVPGIVLFGPSSPIIWGHKTNINISANVFCSPCIDLLRNVTCPHGTLCMKLIELKDIREAILSI